MKIGLLTIQKSSNYGANLQSYALYNYLKQNGYSVQIIDLSRLEHKNYRKEKDYPLLSFSLKYYNHESIIITKYVLLRRLIKKIFLYIPSMFRKKIFSIKFDKDIKQRDKKFESFFKTMNFTKTFSTVSSLYETELDFTHYIVGSDQVWNPYINHALDPYFLSFVKNGKKISYAASIGTEYISKSVLGKIKKWLMSFSNISVREEGAKQLLNSIGLNDVQVVVDPTLLLNKTDWDTITSDRIIQEDYLFYFGLTYSEDLFNLSKKIQQTKNLKLVYLCKDENDYFKLKNKEISVLVNVGIEDFLSLIKYSSFVITDSFHGSVFSIIFNKLFLVYIDEKRRNGSRIVNLLDLFDMNNRLVSNLNNIDLQSIMSRIEINQECDSDKFNIHLQQSKEFLFRVLHE